MRLKPELKGALFALCGVAAVLAGFWVFTGIRLHIWTYNEYDRYIRLTANLPVARALWHDKIRAGEDVNELSATWHPHRSTRFSRWVELRWYPGGLQADSISLIGIWILAKDGVVVAAYSYADDGLLNRSFFDTRTPAEKTEHRAAFKAFVDALEDGAQKSVKVGQ